MTTRKLTLTDRLAHSAKLVPGSGQREYFDAALRGFGVRVTTKGARTFFLAYRFGGKPRRLTLGPAGEMKVAAARVKAEEARALIRAGQDPNEARKAAVAAAVHAAAHRPVTVADLVEEYLAKRVRVDKLRSADNLSRLFALHVVAAWRERPAREIGRADVIALLDGLRARGLPVQANRVFAAMRTMFAWAAVREYVTVNPCIGVERPTPEVPRDRTLSDGELWLFWHGCKALSPAYRSAFRLLALTGQRRTETCCATGADIDAEGRRLWTIPAHLSKNGKAHGVPLSELALSVIAEAPGSRGPIFTTDGSVPIREFVRSKGRLDAAMLKRAKEEASAAGQDPAKAKALPHWTLHDLRRTVASGMARLGVEPHVIEKVLNHTPKQISGVAAIYNRHGYDDEKRRALDLWARHMEAVIERRAGSNVVALADVRQAEAKSARPARAAG